jgi:hypothetical protein
MSKVPDVSGNQHYVYTYTPPRESIIRKITISALIAIGLIALVATHHPLLAIGCIITLVITGARYSIISHRTRVLG